MIKVRNWCCFKQQGLKLEDSLVGLGPVRLIPGTATYLPSLLLLLVVVCYNCCLQVLPA